MADSICPRCGERERAGGQSYCRECFREYKRIRREARIETRQCVICGSGYRSPHALKISCSEPCAKERERRLAGRTALHADPIECPTCGTAFTMRNSTHKFCSKGCTMIAHGKWSGKPRVTLTETERAARRRASQQRWAESNPDHVRKPAKRETIREGIRRRRARLRLVQTSHLTARDVEAKLAYWGNRCWMCAEPATSLDHVKPLSAGGPHILANFRPACGRCNSSKGGRWFGVHGLERFKAA